MASTTCQPNHAHATSRLLPTLLPLTNERSCPTVNCMLVPLSLSWRSTLVPHTALSHIVSWSEEKFRKFSRLRGKLFVSLLLAYLHCSHRTRYPGQELACGDAKVPSVLYYDRDGNFRAAGSEALAESVIEVALAEGWTKAEWLVVHHIGLS